MPKLNEIHTPKAQTLLRRAQRLRARLEVRMNLVVSWLCHSSPKLIHKNGGAIIRIK
jgi:hypothetical protein